MLRARVNRKVEGKLGQHTRGKGTEGRREWGRGVKKINPEQGTF